MSRFVEWIVWWLFVFLTIFLGYQLSRPLWDLERLISDFKAKCQGTVVEKKGTFGTTYVCEK